MDDLDRESVQRRLNAVERALSDGDPIERRDRLDDLDARVAELEAAVQALRGYVGTVRAVNDEIEHRAEIALRKASALEQHVTPDKTATSDETGETSTDPAAETERPRHRWPFPHLRGRR